MDSNIVVSSTEKGGILSTTKTRKTFFEKNYPVVIPVQYTLDSGHTAVYIPILEMLQKLCRHTDILDKLQETKKTQAGHYMSNQDGLYFRENDFFCSSDEPKLPLILYIDDLEIANPLGTSRKIHKLSSIYWILADLPSKYRSGLHVIQLAVCMKELLDLCCEISILLNKMGFSLSPLVGQSKVQSCVWFLIILQPIH